jgi:hypothetical protein
MSRKAPFSGGGPEPKPPLVNKRFREATGVTEEYDTELILW